MIEKLRVRNFRSIASQEFTQLRNLNVFIGKNSAGKSTVLNAIKIFNQKNYQASVNDIRHGEEQFEVTVVKSTSEDFYRRSYELSPDSVKNDFIKIFRGTNVKRRLGTKIYFDEFKKYILKKYFEGSSFSKLGVKMMGRMMNDGKVKVSYEFTTSMFAPMDIEVDHRNNFLLSAFLDTPAIVEDERNFRSELTGEPKSITNSVFTMFLDSMNQLYQFQYDDHAINAKSVHDLTIGEINYLLSTRIKKESTTFLKSINRKFENYIDHDFKVRWNFDESLSSRLRLETQFTNAHDLPIDFLSTGSGTRNLYLLALLEGYMDQRKEELKRPGLFLIEEPELYLYPKLEKRMGSLLKELSLENQVFITTHSSALISDFELEDIYYVDSDYYGGTIQSKYRPLTDINELMGTLGFNTHPIFDSKYIFIVEGTSDITSYRAVLKNFFSQVNLDKDCIFIPVNGVNNIQVAVKTQIFKNLDILDRLFIIIDSDGNAHERSLHNLSQSIGSTFEDSEELGSFIKNQVYITEEATTLETLSFDYNLIDPEELEAFNDRAQMFLYDPEIKKIITGKNKQLRKENQGYREFIEKLDEAYAYLYSDLDFNEEKLNILRRYFFTKRLLNHFKEKVYNFENIENIDIKHQSRLLEEFICKIDMFFS